MIDNIFPSLRRVVSDDRQSDETTVRRRSSSPSGVERRESLRIPFVSVDDSNVLRLIATPNHRSVRRDDRYEIEEPEED